jgi:hypothetical protein
MEWTQVATIIGVNIALIAALATLIVWVVDKLDGDIKSVSTDVKALSGRMDGHAMRIDQLYKIIIDILKERK